VQVYLLAFISLLYEKSALNIDKKFRCLSQSLFIQEEFSKTLNLTVLMPKVIKVTQAEYIYTIWDFITEFGGWFGTLFGYCVVDLADALVAIMISLNKLLCWNVI